MTTPKLLLAAKFYNYPINDELDEGSKKLLKHIDSGFGKKIKIYTGDKKRQLIEMTLRNFTVCTSFEKDIIFQNFPKANFAQFETVEEYFQLYCCTLHTGIGNKIILTYIVNYLNHEDLKNFYTFLFPNKLISDVLGAIGEEYKQEKFVNDCINSYKQYVIDKCQSCGYQIALSDHNETKFISTENLNRIIEEYEKKIENLETDLAKNSILKEDLVKSREENNILNEKILELEKMNRQLQEECDNLNKKILDNKKEVRIIIYEKNKEINELWEQLEEMRSKVKGNDTTEIGNDNSNELFYKEQINSLKEELSNKWDNSFIAAEQGDHKKLKKLIQKDQLIKNSNGQTPLHFAAASGNKKCIKYLLHVGYKADDKDVFDSTPLDWSSSDEVTKLLQMFIENE